MLGKTYASDTKYYLNTTTEYCNLSNLYESLGDVNDFTYNRYKAIEGEVADIKNTLDSIEVKTIQFYPRTQRKCRNPIEIELKGISMQPVFYDGDYIFMDKVKFQDVELGDIIDFRREDSEIGTVHAVIGTYKNYLVTAGYTNDKRDDVVYPDQVMYRYCVK